MCSVDVFLIGRLIDQEIIMSITCALGLWKMNISY